MENCVRGRRQSLSALKVDVDPFATVSIALGEADPDTGSEGGSGEALPAFRMDDERCVPCAAGAATNGECEFQSQHDYTLEEFALSKKWIQEELGPLLNHYSLAR